MSKKYTVYCEKQFLGHYYNSLPKEAVKRAIRENWTYYPDDVLDIDAEFTAQKDTMSPKFHYTWDDLLGLFPHIDENCVRR